MATTEAPTVRRAVACAKAPGGYIIWGDLCLPLWVKSLCIDLPGPLFLSCQLLSHNCFNTQGCSAFLLSKMHQLGDNNLPLHELVLITYFKVFSSLLNGGGHCSSGLQINGDCNIIMSNTIDYQEDPPFTQSNQERKSVSINDNKERKQNLINWDPMKQKKSWQTTMEKETRKTKEPSIYVCVCVCVNKNCMYVKQQRLVLPPGGHRWHTSECHAWHTVGAR